MYKPSQVSTAGILLIIGGVVACLVSFAWAAATLCLWLPWVYGMVAGIFAIVDGFKLVNAKPGTKIPKAGSIMLIVNIINGDLIGMILGVISLVLLSDSAVSAWSQAAPGVGQAIPGVGQAPSFGQGAPPPSSYAPPQAQAAWSAAPQASPQAPQAPAWGSAPPASQDAGRPASWGSSWGRPADDASYGRPSEGQGSGGWSDVQGSGWNEQGQPAQADQKKRP
jgi:hypothetical protein